MVPPCSDRISRVPPYSRIFCVSTHTGLSPTTVCLSRQFWFFTKDHWPVPRSLATTNGVSVDVLSSGYLDVSVPQVRLYDPMYSDRHTTKCGGFPHSEIRGSKNIGLSPRLIAAYHVLHRLSVPRHPQNALMRLIRTQLIISINNI